MAEEIIIEVEAPEGQDFGPQIEQAEELDGEMFAEVSPKGRFSSKALNPLVKATNALLPVFGQDPSYPVFDSGTYEVFPEDFVRILSMFSAASRDAASDDVVPVELVSDFSEMTNDNDLQVLAGKLQGLAKSKDFKRWMKEPKEVVAPEPVGDEEPGPEMSEDEIDSLFEERL